MKKLTTTLLFTLALGTALAGDESLNTSQADANEPEAAELAYKKARNACDQLYANRWREVQERIQEAHPEYCDLSQYMLYPEDPETFQKKLNQVLTELPMNDDLRVIRYLSLPKVAQQKDQKKWEEQVDIQKLSNPVLALFTQHCIQDKGRCDPHPPLKALQLREEDWSFTWLLTLMTLSPEEDPQDILALLANSEKIESLWIQPELLKYLLLFTDQVMDTDVFHEQIPESANEELMAINRYTLAQRLKTEYSYRPWLDLDYHCRRMLDNDLTIAAEDCYRFARKGINRQQTFSEPAIMELYFYALDWLLKEDLEQEHAKLNQQRESLHQLKEIMITRLQQLTPVACSHPEAARLIAGYMKERLLHGQISASQWFTQQDISEIPKLDVEKLMLEYGKEELEEAALQRAQCLEEARALAPEVEESFGQCGPMDNTSQ